MAKQNHKVHGRHFTPGQTTLFTETCMAAGCSNVFIATHYIKVTIKHKTDSIDEFEALTKEVLTKIVFALPMFTVAEVEPSHKSADTYHVKALLKLK